MTQYYILFFDINKTIIDYDSSKNIDSEQAIAKIISENVSGKWSSTTEFNTFRNFIEKQNEDRNKSQNYKQVYDAQYTKINPDILELHKKLSLAMQCHKEKYNGIFASFIRLIHFLDANLPNNIQYKIVLRTFGHDRKSVVDALNKILSRKMNNYGSMIEEKDSSVVLEYKCENDGLKKKITDPNKLVELFVNSDGHWSVQDNYQHWENGNHKYSHGKPFPHHDRMDVHCIFFDDNVSKKQIINPMWPYKVSNDQLSIQHKKLCNKHHIVAVDTVQAILDDDYFINQPCFNQLRLKQI